MNLLPSLESGLDLMQLFLTKELPDEKLHYSYAQGKWTVAEVLLHLIDAERVFQYRALRFARGDTTELKGFDQDTYVPESNAIKRTRVDILEEFLAVRNATLKLYGSLDGGSLERVGVANGAKMSVRALGFVISGHQQHHLAILRERYL